MKTHPASHTSAAPLFGREGSGRIPMLILTMAFRNLLRQRRRSLLTGLMMVIGYILYALTVGTLEGSWGTIVEVITRDHTGHAQIHATGYLDQPSLSKNFADTPELYATLAQEQNLAAATPRVRAAALAFVETKTTGVQVIGIDPQRETAVTRIANKVHEGTFLPPAAAKQALIARTVADILKARVGSELTLISQGADGSIANDLFTVIGILGDTKDASEQNRVYLHIADAQEYLALDGKVHEIALLYRDRTTIEPTTTRLGAVLATAGFRDLSLESWMEIEPEFYRTMRADKKGGDIQMFIILLIVAVGVLNTVLMAVLERTREYGVMAALGTRPRQIFSLIVLETGLLAILSSLVGAILGSLALWYFAAVGITYPEPVTVAGYALTTLTAEITPAAYYKPFLIIFLTALLVSIVPALRAARIKPVDALRSL